MMAIEKIYRYGYNLIDIHQWEIRSQAPKSQLSRDMEKVQRLDVCGYEKLDKFL